MFIASHQHEGPQGSARTLASRSNISPHPFPSVTEHRPRGSGQPMATCQQERGPGIPVPFLLQQLDPVLKEEPPSDGVGAQAAKGIGDGAMATGPAPSPPGGRPRGHPTDMLGCEEQERKPGQQV